MSTVKICPKCKTIASGNTQFCPSCETLMIDSYCETSTWNNLSSEERTNLANRTIDLQNTSIPTTSSSSNQPTTKKKGNMGCIFSVLLIFLFLGLSGYIYNLNHPTNKPNSTIDNQDIVISKYPTLGLPGFATSTIKQIETYGYEIQTFDNPDGTLITYVNRYEDSRLVVTLNIEYDKQGDPGIISMGCVPEGIESVLVPCFDWVDEWQEDMGMFDWIKQNVGSNAKKLFGNIVVETTYNPETGWSGLSITSEEYLKYCEQFF